MTAKESVAIQRSVWAEMVKEMDHARSWNQGDDKAQRHEVFVEVQEFCQRKVESLTKVLEA